MRDFSLDVDAHRKIAGEGALGLLRSESDTDQIPSAEPLPFGLGRRLPGAEERQRMCGSITAEQTLQHFVLPATTTRRHGPCDRVA